MKTSGKRKRQQPVSDAGKHKKAEASNYEARTDHITIEAYRQQFSATIPPVTEIARIAAILTRGPRFDAQTAARQALELWQACDKERNHWIEGLALRQVATDKDRAKQSEPPKAKKYPATLDEFLRIVMRKKRPEDRMKVFRESIRASIRLNRCYQPSGNVLSYDSLPIPTDDEVAENIQKIRERQFNEQQFADTAQFVWRFMPYYERETRSKRGKSGAAGKWKTKVATTVK
jgi:hypothetical protein